MSARVHTPEHRHDAGLVTAGETGADAVGGSGSPLGPDAQDEEHSFGAPILRAAECLPVVIGDLIVAALDVDHHELTLVLGAEPGADFALVDLTSTRDYLFFRYARVTHAHIVRYGTESPRRPIAARIELCAVGGFHDATAPGPSIRPVTGTMMRS